MSVRSCRRLALVCATALVGGLVSVSAPISANATPVAAAQRYVNPVSKTFADTFADPAVIRAKDGYWYAYATSDPLREGQTEPGNLHIARSRDLMRWDYVGDAFTAASRPSWADPTSLFWAPDIRFINGNYYLYYTVTNTTKTAEDFDNAIGVATAPTPAGPWTDSGRPLIAPRRGGPGNNFKWNFDAAEFNDTDGKRYLYFGSYYGGVFVTELTPDGTARVGKPTMVGIDNRFEGAYVVKRYGYYYLFASSANCCAGPSTGYSVFAGRSRSPRGPFLDRAGLSMTASRAGGTIVIEPNGNKWVGTGHNALVTDLSGQDFLVYHAINRRDPYLNEPGGINQRAMLIDRLDWIGGWPTVRGGHWASDSAQPAPVTRPAVLDTFNRAGGLGAGWRAVGGSWQLAPAYEGQGFARATTAGCAPTFLLAVDGVAGNRRVEADLRSRTGAGSAVVARFRDPGNYAAAWLDPRTRSLVTDVVTSGRHAQVSRALPGTFRFRTWHNVVVEIRGSEFNAEVSEARLGDPYAQSRRLLPGSLSAGAAGVAARCGQADADNISATRLYTPSTDRAALPSTGTTAFSDGFEGSSLGTGWSWTGPPAATVQGGVLHFPVQQADLVGAGSNGASVVLRRAPAGDYVIETKVRLPLGIGKLRTFPGAGLIAYVNDDLFLRLSTVAIFDTRQVEFGKEQTYAGVLAFGGMTQAPPAETTWLRLAHRVDPANGEHEFRAGVSRDGNSWTWGGVWTLPAGSQPRIGLEAQGLQAGQAPVTARFDYVKIYTGGRWGSLGG